nr:uncharacterized protein LOC129464210 isoform X2 [Symphalangus syndactylus]
MPRELSTASVDLHAGKPHSLTMRGQGDICSGLRKCPAINFLQNHGCVTSSPSQDANPGRPFMTLSQKKWRSVPLPSWLQAEQMDRARRVAPESAWAPFSLPLHFLVCRELVNDDSCRPAGERQCWQPMRHALQVYPAAPARSSSHYWHHSAQPWPVVLFAVSFSLPSHCSWGGPWTCSCPVLPRGFTPMAGLPLPYLEGLAPCARFNTPEGP